MIKINMGCGKRNFGEDWIHIDGGNYDHVDYHNITKLNQFDANIVDLIYCSHVIEYFDREEIIPVLKEWHRVLKPGGILRLAVPNFEAMVNLYIEQGKIETYLGPLYGRMKMNNEYIYHKTVYDIRSLVYLLSKKIGFVACQKWNWRNVDHGKFDDHSQAYLPHMDKVNGTLISLNVECKKFKTLKLTTYRDACLYNNLEGIE